MEIKVETIEEAENVIQMLVNKVVELERRLMIHDEELDTGFRTSFWKKVLFWIDGWPLHKIVERPRWRPWRRWWTS